MNFYLAGLQWSTQAVIVLFLHIFAMIASVSAMNCTCLCKVRASISDKTHPTLPSPPHTRIRNVSNFWNRRKLRHKHKQTQVRMSMNNNTTQNDWFPLSEWLFVRVKGVCFTPDVALRSSDRTLVRDSTAA